ncbi:MAG: penicillin-binding protein 2 [Gammaproteobacteria bacterium]|nr:penicillin-binding protein 2 [Gammaproteobacteria bacterium]
MAPRLTLKDPGHEYRLVRRRVQFAGALMFLLGFMIVARVFYLQVVQHNHFTTLSQNNRVKIVPIAPIRGLIFSRDGVLLADNRPSFSLELTLERVEDIDQTILELRNLISVEESDIARFREQAHKKRRFEGVPLRFNLSDQEVARFSVNRHKFPGVDVVARLNRYYPLGQNLAHTVGYVGMIDEVEFEKLDKSNYSGTSHVGKIGVEKAYEELLHGRVGYRQVEVNAQGRVIRELDRTAPIPGKNIHLTLDVSLQNLAAQALESKRGAIVAVDPRDGAVLALVSAPAYDPNLFVNGIDTRSYRELLNSRGTPLLNRVLQGKYPPGSAIKPFMAFAALEFGVRQADDEVWCPGWYALKGSEHRYRDWKKGGHGHLNLIQAVAQSCDVYFYSLAHDLGIDRVHDALARFGFGAPTGIDIGDESSGLVPSREWKQGSIGQPWYPGETLILGIGQGYTLVTPMQLAAATATLAARGRRTGPHLLAEARDSLTGESLVRSSGDSTGFMAVRDPSYWDTVIDAMREVVHGARGTARRAGLQAQYEFAGKTGTAQVIGIAQDGVYKVEEIPEELRDHALFIAFGPIEAPRIAVAIVIENAGSGSSSAAPIARLLFDHFLNLAHTLQASAG